MQGNSFFDARIYSFDRINIHDLVQLYTAVFSGDFSFLFCVCAIMASRNWILFSAGCRYSYRHNTVSLKCVLECELELILSGSAVVQCGTM